MSEPVATPVVIKDSPIEQRVRSATDEGEILDEGLDLSGYRGTHDSPFAADYFGLRDLYKTNPEISEQIDMVTEFLVNKTEGVGLVYAAKDILDQITGELNVNDNDSGIYKLKQALKLISAKAKLENIDRMKAQALADIENMV